MIDLGLLAVEEESVPVTVFAKVAGSYDADGDYVPASPTEVIINAAIQPTSGRQLLDLPEGIRAEARYMLWSRSALALDDVVLYGGSRYRVIFLWPRPDGGYTKAALGLTK